MRDTLVFRAAGGSSALLPILQLCTTRLDTMATISDVPRDKDVYIKTVIPCILDTSKRMLSVELTETHWRIKPVGNTSLGAAAFGHIRGNGSPEETRPSIFKLFWLDQPRWFTQGTRDMVNAFKTEFTLLSSSNVLPRMQNHGVITVPTSTLGAPEDRILKTLGEQTYVGWIEMERLDPIETLDGKKLFEALDTLHRDSITHGDIRHDNVMQRRNGEYVFIDIEHGRRGDAEDPQHMRRVELDKGAATQLMGMPFDSSVVGAPSSPGLKTPPRRR